MKATKINNTILLNRSILDWGWYKDTNTSRLFIHLLLRVNYKDKTVNGIKIKRGEVMTSIDSLRYETGMTTSSIRTCISKLIKTSEIASKSTNKYRIITVLKYDTYQLNSKPVNKQDDKQLASQLAPNNKDNQLNQFNVKKSKPKIYFDNENLNSLFNDFLKQRKSPKIKNTDRAIKLLLTALKPYEDNIKTQMIEKSIVSGWPNLYELNTKYGKDTKEEKGTNRYDNVEMKFD